MTGGSLSCRCRFCGFSISYARENIGQDAHCPQCRQTIRLPGRLSEIAVVRSSRRKDHLAMAMEMLGFAAMFFAFPWGILGGTPLVYLGWRKSRLLACSNCGSEVPSKEAERCPACKSRFGRE